MPEVCEEGMEAAKSGYKNICEIGKEHICRAAKKIRSENPLFAGDMGFKVFKLDTSNIVQWNPNADELRENLLTVMFSWPTASCSPRASVIFPIRV